MNDSMVIIETDNGNRFVGDVENIEIDVEEEHYSKGITLENREYRLRVGTLINEKTGEEL